MSSEKICDVGRENTAFNAKYSLKDPKDPQLPAATRGERSGFS